MATEGNQSNCLKLPERKYVMMDKHKETKGTEPVGDRPKRFGILSTSANHEP